ncbi:BMP family lipoprotein [Clostridium beijerinckii]|jgi:nucleoside-binding protein|uniref:BMP family ABC transporter substrate-binding protein n=2 Tax=Clostridium beijerinckii TaxID=1520 RepID=A0AAE2V2H8_CLOBE|nr:BMP family ABC transporter substrate-binding protein [Clostridium beijerinckii]ABR36257.1 basic membrane lipoprotein [Clostridium beijerinckii NCIMB 8052]AIU01913.1 basic membrane lipoprotein [Clostridium beijerinckii ATCC 35702]MBF7809096.1 BMP family ABC transporter substrate-binding protein [Clostridium beijerinckii]MDG5856045.1 BMP family ABC transporter substrate-binding protein [Clostridium beijerinckii]NRT22683.1 basic membrane protein A [Clostridium beijerinckii]
MKKRLLSLLAVSAITVTLFAGCGSSGSGTSTADKGSSNAKEYQVAMVTDTGGVNDQSFNQSSWEGLQNFEKNNKGAKVSYLESKQESDYATNLDKVVDSGNKLVWGIGFAMSDAILKAAKSNPDVNYAIVDNSYGDDTPANVTGVMFNAQEPSFIVGYIAAKTTKTGKVGFVGGIKSGIIDQFQYGYQAGVQYAAKELGKDITVDVQYAESFSDASKGKAIANKMFSSGCDIVFHAAGGVGVGVIEAAKEANKFAIGVDRDQAYLAPDNVLTSALKLANVAVENLSKEAMSGNKIGGKTYTYGLKENAVGIPTENKNMDPEVYKAAMAVQDKIKKGEIVPPYNEDTFKSFGK